MPFGKPTLVWQLCVLRCPMLFSVGIHLAAPMVWDRTLSPGPKRCCLEWIFCPITFHSPSLHPHLYHAGTLQTLSFLHFYFSHPLTAMLWITSQQLIFYLNEVLSEMVTVKENKERRSYQSWRLACAVTQLSWKLWSVFQRLFGIWVPRHCLRNFNFSSCVQSRQHNVMNYKSNPASLNAFCSHILDIPIDVNRFIPKQSSFCCSLQCLLKFD